MQARNMLLGMMALTTLTATAASAQDMSAEEIRANIAAQIRAKEQADRPAAATRGLKLNNHQDAKEPLYPKPAPGGSASAPAPAPDPAAAPPSVPALDLTIGFDTASDRIRPDAAPTLQKMAAVLGDASLNGHVFLIIGHTDSRGGADYNRALSQRRAASVVAALVNLQVPRDRIVPLGMGEDQPRQVDGRAPTDAENRRVQIKLLR